MKKSPVSRSLSCPNLIGALVLQAIVLVACGPAKAVNTTTPVIAKQPQAEQTDTRPQVQRGPDNIRAFDPEASETAATPNDPAVPADQTLATSNEAQENQADQQVAVDLQSVMGEVDPDIRIYYQHVITLANPYFEGRAPTTDGFRRAESYVEFYLEKYGLDGPFETTVISNDKGQVETRHRQAFTFSQGRGRTKIENQAASVLDIAFKPDEDFRALGNSNTGTVSAPITFVGYAIESGPDGYTSFDEDTDLTGRIAMLLRYEPLDEKGQSQWSNQRFSGNSSIAAKFEALQARKPSGIIMVNPPDARDGRRGLETLRRTSRFEPSLDVPAIQMTPEAANQLLQSVDPEQRDLMTLRRAADSGEIKSLNLSDVEMTFGGDVVQADRITTDNVAGVLPGYGNLADQWVVVGAHLDHVGYGYTGTTSRFEGQLHPGADDNASGSAALLVMADRLSKAYKELPEDTPRRSVLLIWFGAEEAGLHGSAHFVENPTMPVEDIQAMINFDMVGRLRNDNLSISGTGTAEEFDEILPPHYERSGLTIAESPGGLGPSDHASFYRAGVPVLFPFTGLHDDYHTPADRAFTVNPEGAMKVVDFAEPLVLELALMPEKLTLSENTQSDSNETPSRTGASVRLGIMPSYGGADGKGVKVEAVSSGTSADKGGIKKGDVMIKWNDNDLDGPRTLGEMLRQHKPGDTVTIVVRRGGKEETLTLTLEGR